MSDTTETPDILEGYPDLLAIATYLDKPCLGSTAEVAIRLISHIETLLDAVRSLIQQVHDLRAEEKLAKPRRTRAEVLAARSTPYGCCNRHADNSACDCLEEAVG